MNLHKVANMKDLSTLTDQELKDFFNSFDWILSDVDGVIWNLTESIPGTQEAVRSLKKIGKRMIFVSNNTIKTLDVYASQFKTGGFDVDKNDIVTPAMTMVSCLRKHNFDKKVFVIGMDPLKQRLQEAGFRLAENGPATVRNLHEFVSNSCHDCEDVGAVISDVDLSLHVVDLQKALTFLKRPDVLFLTGATDREVPLGSKGIIVGPGVFHDILEKLSRRKALPMAKPSPYLNELILEKYKIDDISKVLFVGDSIPEDMAFATNCGYRKLLVLSGLTKKEALETWEYPEEFKPDFYATSLSIVHDLILRVFGDLANHD